MQRYLLQRGIASQKIILEEASTTSEENLRNTARLLRELSGEEKPPLLIFTSDYHLYRAQILARPYYSPVYGVGAKSPVLVRINYMLGEYLALFKMWADKYWSLWRQPDHRQFSKEIDRTKRII